MPCSVASRKAISPAARSRHLARRHIDISAMAERRSCRSFGAVDGAGSGRHYPDTPALDRVVTDAGGTTLM